MGVFFSIENGEKAEKAEPEPEVKEEEPEEEEERTMKTTTKKDKKPAGEGFQLWNELEVQRIKFMVSRCRHLIQEQKPASVAHIMFTDFILSPQNYLSRNFYNLRFLALFIAFALNFILLFYKVCEFKTLFRSRVVEHKPFSS